MVCIGGMGEWLKPTDLKSVKAATSSGVRIPLPPPEKLYKKYVNYHFFYVKNKNMKKIGVIIFKIFIKK